MHEADITRLLHSRYGYLLLLAVAVGMVVYAATTACPVEWPAPQGVSAAGLPYPGAWIASHGWNVAIGLLLTVATSVLLEFLNKHFTLIKGMSVLPAGLYMVIAASLPPIAASLSGGTLLAPACLVAAIPLFTAYQRPSATRRVFIAFFTITLTTMICRPIAVPAYMLVFMMGCGQMRCATMRGYLAALLGVVTPLWILWGFGMVDASCFIPDIPHYGLPAVEEAMLMPVAAWTLITLLLGCGLGAYNLLKVYGYNARARAYNGFVTILAIATVIMLFVDLPGATTYLPLVGLCTAYQIGHFFTIFAGKRSYIGILTIILCYAAIYAWAIVTTA